MGDWKDEGRAIWEYAGQNQWHDGKLEVILNPDGILLSIEQEHAVDSYNSEFTSDCFIPWDAFDQLLNVVRETRKQPKPAEPESGPA